MESERYSQNMENLLIQIARKQRELFLTGFDMVNCEPVSIEKPKRGFFRHRGPTAREILCSELTALQRQTMDRLPDALDQCWWKMPWETVEKVMQTVLYEPGRDKDWRFESTLESIPGEEGLRYVLLSEEGVSQTYTQERICQYEEVSDYSREEREKIMACYDEAVREHNLAQAREFEYSGACAKSPFSAKIYKDFAEYYDSEGQWTDEGYRTNYEQRLYKDKYVEGACASVSSRARTKGVFVVGCYKTDSSGRLTGFRSFDYYPVRIVPENLKHVLLSRRISGASIYKLCEFMSTDNNIQKIPFSLINGAASTVPPQTSDGGFNLMCVKSILFTLLADKLVLS